MLTLVPIKSQALASTPVSGSHSVRNTALDDCPIETVNATLASREVTPVLNVSGLSQLRDLQLSDISIHVGLDPECPKPEVDWRAAWGMQGMVGIGQPKCGQDIWPYFWPLEDGAMSGTVGIETAGDGDVLMWAQSQDEMALETDASFGDESYRFSSTGLVAKDQWCLTFLGAMTITLQSGTMTGADPTTNNFCVSLSK